MSRRRVFAWFGASALLLSVVRAGALDKRACVAASDEGQQFRSQGKLIAARERLASCADPSCPSVVRQACDGWLTDLERTLPSIIVDVKRVARSCEQGSAPTLHDVADVVVSLDGRPLATGLAGRAVELDPGPHVLRLEAAAMPAHEETVVVHEGEKARSIRVTLEGPAPTCARHEATPTGKGRGLPTGFFVSAGVSALALGTFTYLALRGNAEYHGLLHSCAPSCSSADVAPVNSAFIAADVSLGVGLVAAGAAALWLLLTPERSPGGGATGITPTGVRF